MINLSNYWTIIDNTNADDFLTEMVSLGEPTEVSLVGVFGDDSGRGSTRDIDLPMHRDGDYSSKVSEKKGIQFDKIVDIVGLYCIKEGTSKTLIECDGKVEEIILKKNQAIVFDNKKCRHARKGQVGDRLLLRVWIKRNE